MDATSAVHTTPFAFIDKITPYEDIGVTSRAPKFHDELGKLPLETVWRAGPHMDPSIEKFLKLVQCAKYLEGGHLHPDSNVPTVPQVRAPLFF